MLEIKSIWKMDYLQKIIHEEMKKKLNEGFFDRFKGKNDRYSEEESRQRINKALQNFRQSLINVCGNLLRYGQTIQDYQSVRTAGELEKYANKYISSIGGYIYNIGKQEGDVLIPDSDYEDDTRTVRNIPRPPQDKVSNETEQEPQQEPQPQPDDDVYDDPHQRGYLTPKLYIAPKNEVKIEYVRKPTVETNRYGKRIVFFDDGSDEYDQGNSVYKIFVSDDENVGSFELIDDYVAMAIATLNKNDNLFSCCEGSEVEGARRIVTTERGTVVSDGNGERWYVTKKAKIEFQR